MMESKKEERLLQTLADWEGSTVMEMLKLAAFDSVVPAICIDCDCVTDMEPDQTEGYCPECERNTVVSCLVLAGII